jgi:hypothetical protein
MNEQEISDYLRGQRDCKEGVQGCFSESSAYKTGYEHQYALEQFKTELNIKQETIH